MIWKITFPNGTRPQARVGQTSPPHQTYPQLPATLLRFGERFLGWCAGDCIHHVGAVWTFCVCCMLVLIRVHSGECTKRLFEKLERYLPSKSRRADIVRLLIGKLTFVFLSSSQPYALIHCMGHLLADHSIFFLRTFRMFEIWGKKLRTSPTASLVRGASLSKTSFFFPNHARMQDPQRRARTHVICAARKPP